MSLHRFSSDKEIERSLKDWGQRQEAPAFIRQRILNQAGADVAERRGIEKFMARLNGFVNVYVLPKQQKDIASFLFMRAARQSFENEIHELRLVS